MVQGKGEIKARQECIRRGVVMIDMKGGRVNVMVCNGGSFTPALEAMKDWNDYESNTVWYEAKN